MTSHLNHDLSNPGDSRRPMPSPELRQMAHDCGMAWAEFWTATQFLMLTLVGRTQPRQPVARNPFDGLP